MFDSLLRKCIGTICNLDHTDLQWLRASLPVKNGGLGVRRVSSLASSSFLASAAATDTLQQQLVFRSSIADHGCFSVHDQGRLVVSVRHRLSHWSSSKQTVNVGQGRHCIRKANGERRHWHSSTVLSYVTPQKWLAARTSTVRLRSTTWWPRHPHRCWTSTGCKHIRASPVPLRSACWCKSTAWSVVQRGQRSIRKASQPERLYVESDGEGGQPGVKGAVRPALELMRSDLAVSHCCHRNEHSASCGTS